MTQQEWDNATEEERTAEFERCKDARYVYNNYWLRPGQKQISQEDWESMMFYFWKPREIRTRFPGGYVNSRGLITYDKPPEWLTPKVTNENKVDTKTGLTGFFRPAKDFKL